MIRRWRRGVVLAPVAPAVVAGVLLAPRPWGGEEAVGETVEYRVCNVVVEHAPGREENRWQPGGLKVTVTSTGDRGWTDLGMRIEIENMPDVEADRVTAWHESGVTIDGETGAILSEVYDTSGDEALIEPVLATVRVEPVDPATAPWPYTDRVQVPPERFREGNLDYRLPDPGAGLMMGAVFMEPVEPPMPEDFSYVVLHNCRSQMWIGHWTGNVRKDRTQIHPDDRVAFETFLESIEVLEGGWWRDE